jgi:hypothetical protein
MLESIDVSTLEFDTCFDYRDYVDDYAGDGWSSFEKTMDQAAFEQSKTELLQARHKKQQAGEIKVDED